MGVKAARSNSYAPQAQSHIYSMMRTGEHFSERNEQRIDSKRGKRNSALPRVRVAVGMREAAMALAHEPG
jgi:hypothetical protein